MKRMILTLAALLASAVSSGAQTMTPMATGGGGSAHVKSTWRVGGATIAIEYGRPALKGRAESQMMPAGKPWRTGSDVASILTTDRPLTFGTITLKPGRYTINTVPGAAAWELLFGTLKTPRQWGVPYQADLEIGRVPMTLARAKAPAEQVTFSIDPVGGNQVLRMEWGTTSVSAPFIIRK
jgi:hypothetical protein